MTEIVVATRKGLFTYARSGRAWSIVRTHFLGDRVSMTLWDARDGVRYAALDHGHFGSKLHRSEDGGATYAPITVPAYPPKPEGASDKNSMGKEVPWNVELIWSLAAGGKDEPGALWCGTIPGGLFRSADRGASWHLVESMWRKPERAEWFGGGYDWPGIHSICVDPRDSRRVVIAISCGGVWQTRDRGETWELCAKGMRAGYMPPGRQDEEGIQDPHRMVQCRDRPDYFWVQHHSGIFRSVDNAATWTEVTGVMPSSFGFAVAVDPRDGDRAYFVPGVSDEHRVPVGGRLVVNRTEDGGRSMTSLNRGLPESHAYDLVYRHGLAIDASGEILAFGSTTGSLWVSEDRGDSWTALNHHLPPIAHIELCGAA